MEDKKKWFNIYMERRGLYIRLSVIFSLFFFVPLLGFLYFGLKYDILGDQFIPVFILILLGASLAGHVMIRKTFDSIRNTSKQITDSLSRDLTGFNGPHVSGEMQGILQSFHAVESELRSSFKNVKRRTSQLSTLKELSDLCYVTFDSDDLFEITLERAMKLTNSDIGSVLILEGQKRDAFVIHATFGLGEFIKPGEKVDFATSIARFAVINKSPLLIDDIEKDSRFGRANRTHYATKAFLLMPLRGIRDVFGVLTLSRGTSDTPYTQDDVDVLAPFLSNAAFTYDNLNLMKLNREDRRQMATIAGICKTLGSSL